MNHLAEKKATDYFNNRGSELGQKYNVSIGDRRLEQKDCRIQLEHNRAPYWEQKLMVQTGRIQSESKLRHMKCHDNGNGDLDAKDFTRWIIRRQAPEFYDDQRKGKPHCKRTLDHL